jgi:hypothetical protein
VLYGGFVWARRPLNSRFPARAVDETPMDVAAFADFFQVPPTWSPAQDGPAAAGGVII